MPPLQWETVLEEFRFDGSWRDIYVPEAGLAGWQRMIDALRAAHYELTFFQDGEPAELPNAIAQAFSHSAQFNILLSVRFGGMLANCHFFNQEEIEFDIDPREVVGQPQLDGLVGFMRCLSDSTDRDVILCPENSPEIAIFRVRPGSAEVEYREFGGWHDWRD